MWWSHGHSNFDCWTPFLSEQPLGVESFHESPIMCSTWFVENWHKIMMRYDCETNGRGRGPYESWLVEDRFLMLVIYDYLCLSDMLLIVMTCSKLIKPICNSMSLYIHMHMCLYMYIPSIWQVVIDWKEHMHLKLTNPQLLSGSSHLVSG